MKKRRKSPSPAVKELPDALLVFIDDYDGDTPLFVAVRSLDEIPADHAGQFVGTYIRRNAHRFTVERKLA